MDRALLEPVQDPVQVPVTVEHAAAEHGMQIARQPPKPAEEFRRDPLGSELGDQAIIVDRALDVPGSDDEVLGHPRKKATAAR